MHQVHQAHCYQDGRIILLLQGRPLPSSILGWRELTASPAPTETSTSPECQGFPEPPASPGWSVLSASTLTTSAPSQYSPCPCKEMATRADKTYIGLLYPTLQRRKSSLSYSALSNPPSPRSAHFLHLLDRGKEDPTSYYRRSM